MLAYQSIGGLILLISWIGLTFSRLAPERRPAGLRMCVVVCAYLLCDLIALSLLEVLGLSFGPVLFPWFFMALLRCLTLAGWWRIFAPRPAAPPAARGAAGLGYMLTVNSLLLVCLVYALYLEPYSLTVSTLPIAAPKAALPGRALRIAQLSDLHIERSGPREAGVLERLSALAPDVIVLTGDYLNLAHLSDPQALSGARRFMAGLSAPAGIFAVLGNVDPPDIAAELFRGLNIKLLEDAWLRLPGEGAAHYLLGVTLIDRERDAAVLRRLAGELPAESYKILLYHSPEIIEAAAASGIDLYLSGHTHGGQIRMPWYGAIATLSYHGKQYEQGLYQVGPTSLYVSRGIGMEGFPFTPRVRFLCPPEVVLVEFGGATDRTGEISE